MLGSAKADPNRILNVTCTTLPVHIKRQLAGSGDKKLPKNK